MQLTSANIESLERTHLKLLYRTLMKMMGDIYTYRVEGFEFCCQVENNVTNINLKNNTYKLVLSPVNQNKFKSVEIKNLNINELLGYMNLIVLKQGKMLWKAYWNNGGEKFVHKST